jgi:CheY-like chemotaxis protein
MPSSTPDRQSITDASGETIVIVEADDDVREVAAYLLSNLGYNIIEANRGAAALSLLDKGWVADLLMVDFRLPDMSSLQLGIQVLDRWPSLKFLLVTGFIPDTSTVVAQLGEDGILQKPTLCRNCARPSTGCSNIEFEQSVKRLDSYLLNPGQQLATAADKPFDHRQQQLRCV